MRVFILSFVLFSFGSLAGSSKNQVKKNHCLGVDNEKMPLGTRWVFTCNTDPKTKENVWYRYCILDKDKNAKWSKDYTEYDPKGC